MYKNIVIIGAGRTGLSCIKFLKDKAKEILLIDEELSEAQCNLIEQKFSIKFCSTINQEQLQEAEFIIVSPGVDPNRKELLNFKDKIIGDIELFAIFVDKPVIAITGTNGKSTVVTLVGQVLQKSGYSVGVGGNLGAPAIELLQGDHDIYVLELSSFQLELVNSLKADISCILNISPDHLDRHLTMENYIRIKKKIYNNSKHIVLNRDEDICFASENINQSVNSFGLSTEFSSSSSGLSSDNKWLMLGSEPVLEIEKLQVLGMHNWSNLLAVMAICSNYKVTIKIMKEVLSSFTGLPHRCQVVKNNSGIVWINDSKATNVGSTKASILGLASSGKPIILFLGGKSKGQSFLQLREILRKQVKLVILFGQDSKLIEKQIEHQNVILAFNLQEAIEQAARFAKKGDIILFAPGCSSFDMFDNYADRGEKFTSIVNKL